MINANYRDPGCEFWIANRGIAFIRKIGKKFIVNIYTPAVITFDSVWDWTVESSKSFNYKQTAQRYVRRELGEV